MRPRNFLDVYQHINSIYGKYTEISTEWGQHSDLWADCESAMQYHYFSTDSPWRTLSALLYVFKISHVPTEVFLSGSSVYIFQKAGEITLVQRLSGKLIKVRRIRNNWKRDNWGVTSVCDFTMRQGNWTQKKNKWAHTATGFKWDIRKNLYNQNFSVSQSHSTHQVIKSLPFCECVSIDFSKYLIPWITHHKRFVIHHGHFMNLAKFFITLKLLPIAFPIKLHNEYLSSSLT